MPAPVVGYIFLNALARSYEQFFYIIKKPFLYMQQVLYFMEKIVPVNSLKLCGLPALCAKVLADNAVAVFTVHTLQ